jgi:nucleoid DNA-binding protein
MPKSKKEFIALLAKKMNTNETSAKEWVDAYSDTLFEIFKTGNGVTIDGLGGFYLQRRGDSCAFKFNPSQKLKALLGWGSTYRGEI